MAPDWTRLGLAGVGWDHPVRIELDLALPGSAVTGDVLSFKMPTGVFGANKEFDIHEKSASAVVGRCHSISRTVTCSMDSDYFDSYKNGKGTITINDRLDATVTGNGVPVTLDFGLSGVPSPQVVVNGSAPLSVNQASKTGRITTAGAQWEIRVPKVSELSFPIGIEDYPRAGQDCSAVTADVVAYTNAGDDSARAVIGTVPGVANAYGGYNFSIDQPAAGTAYEQLGLSYTCVINDRSVTEHSNVGYISDGRGQYIPASGTFATPSGSFTILGEQTTVDPSMYITSITNDKTAGAVKLEIDPATGKYHRQVSWSPTSEPSYWAAVIAGGKFKPNPMPTKEDWDNTVIKGVGTPGETVEVYRDRWIKGPTTDVEPNCTAKVAADGKWSCYSPRAAYPVEGNWSLGTEASWQALNVRTVRNGQSVIGDPEFWSISAKYSPIAIDFEGNETVQTVGSSAAPAKFDLEGNGVPVSSGWLAPSAGFLAADLDRDGQISSIDELFGGNVGDGFAKLALYDNNRDGVVDANDEGYSRLSIWRDANMNKVVDPGELVTLAEAGVVSLAADHTDFESVDAAGNSIYERSGLPYVFRTTSMCVVFVLMFAIRVRFRWVFDIRSRSEGVFDYTLARCIVSRL